MFSLKKRRLQGILTVAFHYKKGGKRLIREHSDMTRSGSFKLSRGRVRLDMRKKFFTLRVMRHWHRLPREMVVPRPRRHPRSGWMGL